MAEDSVEPEAKENVEASVSPVLTVGVVPPPWPHNMETTFNREGQLITVYWPIMIPPTTPGP